MTVSAALRHALAGRYVVLRELGRGGTATVYLARDLKYGRQVALKVLSPELALAVRSERFRREIEIAAQLSHPHIVPLFEADSVREFHFYTMPFVEGESLRDLLARQGQLPLEESLRIAREVAEALEYAHGRGVVHRDVKPGNILLEAGHARVADFGLARATARDTGDTITQTGTPLGTPAYMSPEQCSADAPIDPRTDVYGLGCVLYEMLTGHSPFRGTTFESILAQKLVDPVPRPSAVRSDLPPWLDKLVATALAKAPDDRIPTAADFGAALATRRAPANPSRHRKSMWKRSRAVALMAGVLALGAILWWRPWRPVHESKSPTDQVLDPRRIAVLYFDDLSEDRHLLHVSVGFTNDLINALSQVEALRVISPEGVRPFWGAGVLLDSIARTLSVGTIVAGSVSQTGNRLRVSVRMIDPATGIQLLSQTVERPMDDLFSLEDEITAEVASGLRVRIGRVVALQQRAGTRSTTAWELVQRADRLRDDGRSLNLLGQWRAALRDFGKADSLLRMAESLDPRWPVPTVARGWLAYDVGLMPPASEGSATVPGAHLETWFRAGVALADRALKIQRNDPRALQLRGVLRYRLWNLGALPDDSLLVAAERDLHAAIAVRPDLARAWHVLASLYLDRARFDDAHAAAERALQTDAYLTEARSSLATLFFTALHLGRRDEARNSCEQGLAQYRGDPQFSECRLMLLGWFGRGRRDIDEAWSALARIEREDSVETLAPTWVYRRMLVAVILARTGFSDSALAVINRARGDGTHVQGRAALLAEAYGRELLGRRAEALQLIEQYTKGNPSGRSYAAATPWFAALHDEPRFRAAVTSP